MFFSRKPKTIPEAADALEGRDGAIPTASHHFVNGNPLAGPYPGGYEKFQVGMGCFWGAERIFWSIPGVYVTAVGYGAGLTRNPTYNEVCSGQTGHNEIVLVVFDPKNVSFEDLLAIFWEGHDPTQGMRQGNDHGTQYRSGIYVYSDAQRDAAQASKNSYSKSLKKSGFGPVTTEILSAGPFYFAEEAHQQYLAKNPGGYCGLGGTGITCPVGTGATA
jgi:peptide-methionine (S)-S-oxide reductase